MSMEDLIRDFIEKGYSFEEALQSLRNEGRWYEVNGLKMNESLWEQIEEDRKKGQYIKEQEEYVADGKDFYANSSNTRDPRTDGQDADYRDIMEKYDEEIGDL